MRWIEGSYVTLRPSFGEAGQIYAYRTEIFWDAEAGHLRFAGGAALVVPALVFIFAVRKYMLAMWGIANR